MGGIEIIDLSSDDEIEKVIPIAVKQEPDLVLDVKQEKSTNKGQLANRNGSRIHSVRQDSENNIFSSSPRNGLVANQGLPPGDDSDISYASPICAAPLTRQFWKAGTYDDGPACKKVTVQNAKNYLHVHPMFLHSNATSHKWAFGAIAELLDNAVDEIQNGATFVLVDKTSNPKDGSPALLIQDDGGGMDPEAMRHCMSFGFSDKKSKLAIGQYGNGFKTSTMRLGADVMVFSRHMSNGVLTQSIGLLSYTFLVQEKLDRIVVPMFNDVGFHGTKVIIYNLWLNDDGNLELDFDTDPEDIRIAGDVRKIDTIPAWREANEKHIAHRFRFCLRVYMSILYLRIPESFRMFLRGVVVQPHNIADDLKYPEFILYKPQVGGTVEATVVTTVGFLKEAPRVIMHGFNVYHKSRLILPFWQVVNYLDSRGRGVVGILQADFVEPTHNKQDFEKTSLFQKLEARLKEMTWEYWDVHCRLLGYREKYPVPKAKQAELNRNSYYVDAKAANENAELRKRTMRNTSEQGSNNKRKIYESVDLHNSKKHAKEENIKGVGLSQNMQVIPSPMEQVLDQETLTLLEENQKLQTKCLESEKIQEELNLKVTDLRSKIEEARGQHNLLLAQLQLLDVKD
ncbi:protein MICRORCHIDIA 6 isoform X2 [Arachis ipaensis]|uniref:protein MICRORCHIDIA 6 isoform X2 n=1 Tax=Arachis ipaensis TaxID=130454 RepID=UPI000A2B5C38|nr:protein MICRORCHIDIA 6 isoform X2 [Arachis ipaensis]XP_025643707.1 protein MICRORCHIDIA 6 isoform X2 [Arachis hypogaea]